MKKKFSAILGIAVAAVFFLTLLGGGSFEEVLEGGQLRDGQVDAYAGLIAWYTPGQSESVASGH